MIARLLFCIAFAMAASARADPAPDLVGKTLSQISTEFPDMDFSLIVQEVESRAPKGRVFLQVPSAGAEMGEGATVYLRLSQGQMIPKGLEGRKAETVIGELEARGFAVERTSALVLGIPEGIVAKVIPSQGTFIDTTQDVVFLQVSNDRGIEIPDLVGMRIGQARDTLEALGLRGELVSELDLRQIGSICEGFTHFTAEVTASSPEPGKFLLHGSTVRLQGKKVVAYTWPPEPCSRDGIPM
ncbi:PASTA domain-containing protein [Stappia sp. MMSF_3263]|uniref:PASTA domain-containing protein n=1 Tax=Stappia sp. MMSF_3263 TaxID=3046693 RepID=UPI00273DD760|nr:PASTA domain-containing protein [Stappia sp. MMSF_3263]